jgi:hypothetical protein
MIAAYHFGFHNVGTISKDGNGVCVRRRQGVTLPG